MEVVDTPAWAELVEAAPPEAWEGLDDADELPELPERFVLLYGDGDGDDAA